MIDFTVFDLRLRQFLIASHIPGMSLALSNGEETIHTFTYFRNTVPQPVIVPETRFEIGSISKSFTSVLFQQLVDNEGFDLNQPVKEILPWFDIKSDYAPITSHHLLTHTAGIINGTEFSGDNLGEVYALRNTETGSEPGTFFYYSNVGYKVLGAILEHVTGKAYHELVQERILEPLGMGATSAAITHDERLSMATGFVPLYDDRPVTNGTPIAPGARIVSNTADGCIVSNPTDLAKYMRMLMNGGQDGVLSKDGFKRMAKPIIEMENENVHYGYGLMTMKTPDAKYIGHGGGMAGGFSTQMLWHTRTGYGVTAMFNAYSVPDIATITAWLPGVLHTMHSGRFPEFKYPEQPLKIANAGAYAGTFVDADDQEIRLFAYEDQLYLQGIHEDFPLTPHGGARFSCQSPEFDRFYFDVQVDGESGTISAIHHGERIFLPEGTDHPTYDDVPDEWHRYRGHFRSHNPWLTAFRVLLRGDQLIWQAGDEEETLIALGDGCFRIGEDERLPERLRFDLIINGKATRAYHNNAEYYRTFTP